MDAFIEILKNCEGPTILAIFGSFTIFYLIMNRRFDRMEQKFEARFEKIDQRFDKSKSDIDARFDKLDEKFEARFQKIDNDIKELRTSLNRMEGAFYSKECCMLKSDHKHAVE